MDLFVIFWSLFGFSLVWFFRILWLLFCFLWTFSLSFCSSFFFFFYFILSNVYLFFLLLLTPFESTTS